MKKMNKACLLSAACALCVGFGVFGGAMLTANAEAQNDKAVFFVQDGASVKLMKNANDSGIRFNFMVKKDYFNTIDFSAMKINAKIIPTALLSEVTSEALIAEESAQYSEIAAENWNAYQDAQGGEWMTSYAYLYGLPSEAYDYDISAVGYITAGNEIVYKTDVATRTMAYVASAALYDEEEAWTAEQQTVLGAYLANYDYELALTAQSNELLKAATADDEDTDCPEIALVTDTKAPVPVTYSSANEEIATVDENGKVTAVAAGKTTITATTAKTTTDQQETATYEVTVYNYHEVESVADFAALKVDDESVYYRLTKSIDFTGTTITYGATNTDPIGTTIAPIGRKIDATTSEVFAGVFDGNGYAMNNVTIGGTENAIYIGVFYQVGSSDYANAAIKNLKIDITVASGLKNTKNAGGLIASMYNATVENCYVTFKTYLAQYKNGNGTAPAGIAGGVDGYKAEVKNCVVVVDITAGVTHPATSFGGLGIIYGGTTSANTKGAKITNSYGVLLKSATDTIHTAKLHSLDTVAAQNQGTITVTNSTAHNSLAEVYASISQEGVLKNNGWGNVWSIKNNTLYFGETAVYTATNA